jgi:general secretion pathway protein G
MTPKRSAMQRLLLVAKVLFVVGGLGFVLLSALVYSGLDAHGHYQGDRAWLDLRVVERAVRLFHAKTRMLPTSMQGMLPLAERDVIESVPRDPWGNPYEYILSEDAVVLRSLGADGAPGGSGSDADIVVRIPRSGTQEAL